jgi:hypothetical protein
LAIFLAAPSETHFPLALATTQSVSWQLAVLSKNLQGLSGCQFCVHFMSELHEDVSILNLNTELMQEHLPSPSGLSEFAVVHYSSWMQD